MAWATVYNATIEVNPATEPITLPYDFQPYYRLIVTAELLTGLGVREPLLGYLRQLLVVPGIGEVKGRTLALTPFQQLFIPSTELPYKLVYQPIQKDFSLNLKIQVESMIVSNGGTADNGPVLAAIAALQAQVEALQPSDDSADYTTTLAAIQDGFELLSVGQTSLNTGLNELVTGQTETASALMMLAASEQAANAAVLGAVAALQSSENQSDAQMANRLNAILAAVTPITRTLTFASAGDENGVFYWLGTFYGQHTWINPQVLQVVTTVVSTIAGGFSVALLTNRSGGAAFYSNDAPGQWVAFDLGANNLLVPEAYALRHDNETGYYLRSWKLQGSNTVESNTVAALAAASWTDLKEHLNDATINSPEAWGSWSIAGVSTGYRWLRVIMTGAESSGSRYLVLGEAEFYGAFTRQV